MYNAVLWKRGRVVEGSSLENCRRCEPFVSSNLTASAILTKEALESGSFFLASAYGNIKKACRAMSRTVQHHLASEHGVEHAVDDMARTVNKLSVVLINKLSSPGYYGDGGWFQRAVRRAGSSALRWPAGAARWDLGRSTRSALASRARRRCSSAAGCWRKGQTRS
jgi:hypothetical protein